MEKIVTSDDVFDFIEHKENELFLKYRELSKKVLSYYEKNGFFDSDLLESKNIAYSEYSSVYELLKELRKLRG